MYEILFGVPPPEPKSWRRPDHIYNLVDVSKYRLKS